MISFLWWEQRIEAGKRESQKVYSLSPPCWLSSAAFSPRNARDDVVQPVCSEALANSVLNETWKPVRTRALLLVMLFIKNTKRDRREA